MIWFDLKDWSLVKYLNYHHYLCFPSGHSETKPSRHRRVKTINLYIRILLRQIFTVCTFCFSKHNFEQWSQPFIVYSSFAHFETFSFFSFKIK